MNEIREIRDYVGQSTSIMLFRGEVKGIYKTILMSRLNSSSLTLLDKLFEENKVSEVSEESEISKEPEISDITLNFVSEDKVTSEVTNVSKDKILYYGSSTFEEDDWIYLRFIIRPYDNECTAIPSNEIRILKSGTVRIWYNTSDVKDLYNTKLKLIGNPKNIIIYEK